MAAHRTNSCFLDFVTAPFHPRTGFKSPYPPRGNGNALVHQTPQFDYAGAPSQQLPASENVDEDDENGSCSLTAASDLSGFSLARGISEWNDPMEGSSINSVGPDQSQDNSLGGSAWDHQAPQLSYSEASSSQRLPTFQEMGDDSGSCLPFFTTGNANNPSIAREGLEWDGSTTGSLTNSIESDVDQGPDRTRDFPYSTHPASLEHSYPEGRNTLNPTSFEYTLIARPLPRRSPFASAQTTMADDRGYVSTPRETPAYWVPGLADASVQAASSGQPPGNAIPARLQRHILLTLPGNVQLVLEFGGDSPEDAEEHAFVQ
ncbi:uncharacterized protein EI90DRAFT_3119164 [Cantharellus anzutake]|uniref:uncharacterized protein n=1 Tax=Cantharellus anzutake TaxID=1750568 RepID=UPI001907AE3C|nr:uncharacterized protein EI90DRAFT_3119164 [Cantharellus anzutake]KAF8336831.1 hypothetical protein EI90DRAFT_3119164 [Cantharellus anzutake]